MKKIFSVVSIILISVILFTLTGCGKEETNENPQENIMQNETTTNIAITKIDDTKDWVYPKYDRTFEYEGWDSVKIEVPSININTEQIRNLNTEIMNDYEDNIKSNNESPSPVTEVSYEFYVNGDIVSVIITENQVQASIPKYEVYNVNIVTGKILDNMDLLILNNITVDQYETQVKAVLDNYFTTTFASMEGSIYYNEQREKNRSNENCNINSTKVFIGENGELQFIADAYSMAGAEKYSRIFNYNIPEEEENTTINVQNVVDEYNRKEVEE